MCETVGEPLFAEEHWWVMERLNWLNAKMIVNSSTLRWKKRKIHYSNSGPQATCGPDKTLAWPSKCILRHKDISNCDVKTEVLTEPCPSYTFASLIMVLRTLCCSCHWVTKVCYLADHVLTLVSLRQSQVCHQPRLEVKLQGKQDTIYGRVECSCRCHCSSV